MGLIKGYPIFNSIPECLEASQCVIIEVIPAGEIKFPSEILNSLLLKNVS